MTPHESSDGKSEAPRPERIERDLREHLAACPADAPRFLVAIATALAVQADERESAIARQIEHAQLRGLPVDVPVCSTCGASQVYIAGHWCCPKCSGIEVG